MMTERFLASAAHATLGTTQIYASSMLIAVLTWSISGFASCAEAVTELNVKASPKTTTYKRKAAMFLDEFIV